MERETKARGKKKNKEEVKKKKAEEESGREQQLERQDEQDKAWLRIARLALEITFCG